eukprot:scaffold3058_cov165-Ochromonas_danica.AAC.26
MWEIVLGLLLLGLIHFRSDAVYEGRRVLVVAGNFTLDGEQLNIAQFDIRNGIWSNKYQAQVYLFGEDNGAILTKTSQIQLCSVARFDGISFEKVGEGLCYRGIDSASILIHTVVLGNGGDLFVGGNFATRVWDGHHFVYVYHVARYDALSSSWLPLSGGGELKGKSMDSARVNALAWDDHRGVLYIGGNFYSVDNTPIPPGLAKWSAEQGLEAFPGGGLFTANGDPGEVQALAFDQRSKGQSLFVAGTFQWIGGVSCPGIAVWNGLLKVWTCLYDPAISFTSVSAVLLHQDVLYLSGWCQFGIVPSNSTWNNNLLRYNIARLDVEGFIDECIAISESKSEDNNDNGNSNHTDTNNSTRTVVGNDSSIHSNSSGVEQMTRRHLRIQHKRLRGDYRHGRHSDHHKHYRSRRLDVDASVSLNSTMKDLIDWVKGVGTKEKSGSKVMGTNSTIPSKLHTPTSAPTSIKLPWRVVWEWLPGFPGTNGPVLKLTPKRRTLDSVLLISGQFSNLPPLLMWEEVILPATALLPTRRSGNTTILGGRHEIEGVISSIAEVVLPYELPPSSDDEKPPEGNTRDYTFVILLACVGVGVLLGLGFTMSCFSKWTVPQTTDMDIYESASDPQSSLGQLSLKTLCDGQGGASAAMDFRECFERAMKIRHLPTYEALVIINPKEILLSRIVGEGSFGRVWSGQWRNNAVAVKEFVFAQAAIAGGSLQRNNIIEEIVGEAGVMACLRHPKILQLYGCSLTMQAIWIVSELCPRGSLKQILMDQGLELPLTKKLSICMDIADGMQYLHNRTPPIIHRDLKSHNIFMTEPSPGHFVAKIGDWGSARAVALTGAKNMTHGVGTACWLSPEVINNAHFSKFSDVYAFGIILWEVYTRQEIYEGLSAAQIIAKVANDGLRPNVPRDCPWSKIMTDCWKQEPVGRPNFQTVLIALSKIYLKLNSKMRSRVNSSSNSSMLASEDDLASTGANSELQPLLSTPSVDGTFTSSVRYDSGRFEAGGMTPITPITPIFSAQSEREGMSPRPSSVKVKDSPSTAAARKRVREFNVDSFHPSIENIELHHSQSGDEGKATASPPRPISSRLPKDSLPYQAPELVHQELALVAPAFIVADEDGNIADSTSHSSGMEERNTSSDADPLDFLFNTRPIHSERIRRNTSSYATTTTTTTSSRSRKGTTNQAPAEQRLPTTSKPTTPSPTSPVNSDHH